MVQADLLTGVVLISFGLVMWSIVLWEKYFPDDDKRFPRKGNEALHKWFEEQRRKKFKP
jgi:hypothetical protein